MKAFLPENFHVVLIIFVMLSVILVAGYKIIQVKYSALAVAAAWLVFVVSAGYTERLTAAEPAGFRMIALILVMLFSMKVVVTAEYYRGRKMKLTPVQWASFCAGWFGMRPGLFESLGTCRLDGGKELITKGIIRLISGIVLLLISHFIPEFSPSIVHSILVAAISLTGISLILHFGILNIVAGYWRNRGADTRTLFRQPLRSLTLTEFWGKRWNIAFSEMTAIAVFRPLRSVAGNDGAMFTAFLFSGFLHTMAISVPVQTAYLLPFIYFVIHGLVMLAEKALAHRGYILAEKPLAGRLWVFFWLLVPLPLLFHKYFVKEIILPLVGL